MPVTNEEIVAVAEGVADRQTERRVLAAALEQPEVRRRLTALRAADAETERGEESDVGFAERAAQLRDALYRAVQEVAQEAPRPAPGWAPQIAPRLLRWAERVWEAPRRPLTLPCLAPASAGTPEVLRVRAESCRVGGVRIEFQQLPGDPPRLRVLVDGRGAIAGYAAAAVLIEPLGAVVVPVNAEGAGWLDLHVVSGEVVAGEMAIPAPLGPVAVAGLVWIGVAGA